MKKIMNKYKEVAVLVIFLIVKIFIRYRQYPEYCR